MITRRSFLKFGTIAALSAATPITSGKQAFARANPSIHCLIDTSQSDAEYVGIYLPTREINFSKINYPKVKIKSNSPAKLDAPASETSINSRSIIGADTRTRLSGTDTFPYRATGFLSTDRYIGTASFASKSMAITAAHVVYDIDKGFVQSAKLYPGRDDDYIPYGPFTVASIYIPIEYYKEGNSDYDYAALGFTTLYGKQTGYLGYQTGYDLSNQYYRIDGYPGETDKRYQLWGSMGYVTRKNKRIIYQIDTTGGMSGTPVATLAGAALPNQIVGIHTNGTDSVSGGNSNSAVAVDDRMFYFMKSFRVNGEND